MGPLGRSARCWPQGSAAALCLPPLTEFTMLSWAGCPEGEALAGAVGTSRCWLSEASKAGWAGEAAILGAVVGHPCSGEHTAG